MLLWLKGQFINTDLILLPIYIGLIFLVAFLLRPKDTILVATFLHDQYSTKKAYFYVASFKEAHSIAKHDQAFSLFSIRWDEEESHWEKGPEYCCFVKSEQPQPPLHKEAANWMFKRMTTKGSGFPDVDYFIKGKFELFI